MKKRIRRVFFFIISILFLGIATIVVMTGIGYVFDFQHGRIQLTGAISLRSIPSDAFISFNGKKIDQRTPDLITRIKPGEYSVSVFKPGLIPWTKIVRVTSKKTEIFDSIRLFRDDIASETIRIVPQYTVILPSHGGDKILSIEKENGQSNIALVKRNTEPIILGRFDELIDPENIQWSFDDQRIVIPHSKDDRVDLMIISVNPNIPAWSANSLFETPRSFKTWAWSDDNPELLIASDDAYVYLINTVQKVASSFLPLQGKQWVLHEDHIAIWSGNAISLFDQTDILKPPEQITLSPNNLISEEAKFVFFSEKITIFQVNGHLQFFLTNEHTLVASEGFPEVKFFDWPNGQKHFAAWNVHELWFVDGLTLRTQLLTRTSGTISKASWLLNGRAIAYQVDKKMHIVSFDRSFDSFFIVELPESRLGNFFGVTDQSTLLFQQLRNNHLILSEQTLVSESGLFR